ncbi:MAG: AAA family ATPase [Kiritimatiellae bacterium]|nr:AAA family ATPase [Kiritimatiellia bacterium]
MEIPRPKSLRELVSEHRDVRKPVVDGLLRPEETLNMIAPPGTGKSRLALSLAVSVATGTPWIGRRCERGNVLVVNTDLSGRTLTARMERALAKFRSGDREAALANIDILDMSKAGRLKGALDRCLDLADGKRYSLIVVDSLNGLTTDDGESERRGEALAMHDAIDAYASERNCAFVLVQHKPVERTAGIINDLASSWTAVAADSNLVLLPASGGTECRMCVTTRSFDDAPLQTLRRALWRMLRAK